MIHTLNDDTGIRTEEVHMGNYIDTILKGYFSWKNNDRKWAGNLVSGSNLWGGTDKMTDTLTQAW